MSFGAYVISTQGCKDERTRGKQIENNHLDPVMHMLNLKPKCFRSFYVRRHSPARRQSVESGHTVQSAHTWWSVGQCGRSVRG